MTILKHGLISRIVILAILVFALSAMIGGETAFADAKGTGFMQRILDLPEIGDTVSISVGTIGVDEDVVSFALRILHRKNIEVSNPRMAGIFAGGGEYGEFCFTSKQKGYTDVVCVFLGRNSAIHGTTGPIVTFDVTRIDSGGSWLVFDTTTENKTVFLNSSLQYVGVGITNALRMIR